MVGSQLFSWLANSGSYGSAVYLQQLGGLLPFLLQKECDSLEFESVATQ
ncbi:hypothetical protein VCR4J5_780133 [Vibrio crassostreae]|uniref:Uncharacterized protein n=1 Tax=Vibrio crassostreae TaxID=246167 RepID=A0ABM9QZT4_9VIBR|nr:hypothetical protein VCR19J5_230366 [Vibrio crassostreae]CDT67486.1 hypothetical protein VCR4J5_780133 [Vibrio crassostreae]